MSNADNLITSTQWLHSCYDNRNDISILTTKVKDITINSDTKEVVDVKSRLVQKVDPERRIWITKKEKQNYKYKKESEDIRNCDVYQIKDRDTVDFLKEKLNISKYTRTNKRKLCDSPYVYGSDITIEALERYQYETNQKHHVCPIVTGALDIETCMIDDDRRINCITVICDRIVHTAALKEFMWVRDKDDSSKDRPAELEELYPLINEHIGKYLKPHKLKINAKVCDTEKELLEFIFNAIQENEPDFMLIWNINFDVPHIVTRMELLGMKPEDYFCSKTIPKNRRYFRYYEDRKKVSHIVEKWNWLHTSSMTQWLDALALYGQVRKQRAKETSYTLESRMQDILGYGKVDLGGLSHRDMQLYHFLLYWVYNIFDACLVQFATWKTQDHETLYTLTEHSTLMDFNKQSVMLGNDYHHVLLQENRVFATVGEDMSGPYDHLLTKIGGAVLPANNVDKIGINCVVEHPNRTTNLLLYVADDDYGSMYPSWKETGNISKDTKVSTLVEIDGMPVNHVEYLCSTMSNPDENAVYIASTYLGLPDYEDMEQQIGRELIEIEMGDLPF